MNKVYVFLSLILLVFVGCSQAKVSVDEQKCLDLKGSWNGDDCRLETGNIIQVSDDTSEQNSSLGKGDDSSNEFVVDYSVLCDDVGGTWLEDFSECEGISQVACEDGLGGVFNECGSACRNDPEAQICTLQCVPFCKVG